MKWSRHGKYINVVISKCKGVDKTAVYSNVIKTSLNFVAMTR